MSNAGRDAATRRPEVARARVTLHGIVDRARFDDYHDEDALWMLVNVPDIHNDKHLTHQWFTIGVRMATVGGKVWPDPKGGGVVRVVGVLRRRRGDGGDIFLEATDVQVLPPYAIVLPVSHG